MKRLALIGLLMLLPLGGIHLSDLAPEVTPSPVVEVTDEPSEPAPVVTEEPTEEATNSSDPTDAPDWCAPDENGNCGSIG